MSIAASHSRWTIRPLRSGERERALAFLDREHELNIYLIARIREAGRNQLSTALGVFRYSELVAVATVSANLAAAFDSALIPGELEEVSALIGGEVIQRSTYLRAIIAPSEIVDALWRILEPHYQAPTVVRLSQPVYLLDHLDIDANLDRVRYGRPDDLDLLIPACAAMHREEIGIDPLERDAFGYRQRVLDLVVNRRSFVMLEGGQIVFKCEISAETDQAVQLMGVWTAPPLRGRGYARLGLTEVCGHLLGRGRRITLFVNDFNSSARELYEKLGFRVIGENRALIW